MGAAGRHFPVALPADPPPPDHRELSLLPTSARLIRAAGLRWPVEEDFEFSKDCFGQSQVGLYTAIARHTILVMAALAICAITTALLHGAAVTPRRHHRTGPASQFPPTQE